MEVGGLAELDPRTARMVRRAGLSNNEDLTLEDVDRRRTELWTTSVVVVILASVVLGLIAFRDDLMPDVFSTRDFPQWFVTVLMSGLALAFLIYVVEKERSLRQLTLLLVEREVQAAALSERLERELETVRKLEELDRLKSEFVSTVSHELKTPLTVIIGAAKTLSTRSERMTPEQVARFTHMIEFEGHRLVRMLNDILSAERIESGAIRLNFEAVELGSIAERVAEHLEHAAVGRDRIIKLNLPNRLVHVRGDADALQQIMLNLVENALKYSETPSPVDVRLRADEHSVVIEVQDRGPGMSAKDREMVFDRFKQVDSALGPVGGFGLGLYIVRNLVEAHAGHIEVDSLQGVGSTFRVTLPRVAVAVA